MSAPAAKYDSCTARTICGCVRLRRSGSLRTSRGWSRNRSPRKSASDSPRFWRSTPHAPSSTRMRSAARLRMWSIVGVTVFDTPRVSDTDARPLRASRDVQLVLRMAQPLLDLPAVGGRLAASDRVELGLRLLELAARALVVDVGSLDRVVHQGDRPVVQHLEEARPGRELEHLAAAGVHARRSRLERGDQGCVPGEHADLAGGAG